MSREEALKIINEENLKRYNFNEERFDREDEAVIKRDKSDWVVYVTNERAGEITHSVHRYSTEEEALDNFIKRLRAYKVVKELQSQRKRNEQFCVDKLFFKDILTNIRLKVEKMYKI